MLFDPSADMAYAISASATVVWEACDGTRTLAELAATVGDRYEAPPDTICHDVTALVERLSELRLVQDARSTEPQ